jgi:U4/U6 small nuclear ribonucleoprotein PRP31
VLAARVDAAHEALDGSLGRHFRDDIDKKIEKMQEPPPNRGVRALPIPDEAKKKRRGGKRYAPLNILVCDI